MSSKVSKQVMASPGVTLVIVSVLISSCVCSFVPRVTSIKGASVGGGTMHHVNFKTFPLCYDGQVVQTSTVMRDSDCIASCLRNLECMSASVKRAEEEGQLVCALVGEEEDCVFIGNQFGVEYLKSEESRAGKNGGDCSAYLNEVAVDESGDDDVDVADGGVDGTPGESSDSSCKYFRGMVTPPTPYVFYP